MQLISHIHNRSRDYFIPLVAGFNQNRLINCFLGIFSAKQATRPDSIITCCRQVVPYIKQAVAQECWKVFFISKRILHISEDKFLKNNVVAIEALNRLENAIENNRGNEVIFSSEEVQVIENFFSKPMSESLFFKLNAYLIFLRKEKHWKTLKAFKEIFLPIQENCIESIQKKIGSIDKFLKQSIESPFSEDSKLTPKDIRLLMVASARKEMLEALNHFQIRYPYSKLFH